VESKWCHSVMVEAYSQLKLLPASTLYIYKVFEHIADPSSCFLLPSVTCIFVVQIQDVSAASNAAITPLWPR
jgi:hypothetical protein